MLSLEAGIIDTTTEEGQAKVEEIERNARLAAERKGKGKPMEDTIMEGVEEEEVLADNGGK